MNTWWKGRKWILAAVCLCLMVGAVSSRPARPAIPAKPVQRQDGPLQGYTILVDAGHGGTDGGAMAKDSGVLEKELNLKVAIALRDALEQSGAQVIMTRETDMELNRNKRADLTARLDLANQGHADMLISIHMNEYRTRGESGPQVFYRSGQEQSRLLAGAIQASMIQELKPAKERSAIAGDYFSLGGMWFSLQPKRRKTSVDRRIPTPRCTSDPGRYCGICVPPNHRNQRRICADFTEIRN